MLMQHLGGGEVKMPVGLGIGWMQWLYFRDLRGGGENTDRDATRLLPRRLRDCAGYSLDFRRAVVCRIAMRLK